MIRKKLQNILDSQFFNVFMFSLFWALQLFVSKLAYNAGAKPVSFTVQAAVVALVVLAIIVLPRNWKELKGISVTALLGVLLVNAIHFGIGGFLSNSGVALTSAINSGFLVKFALVTTIIFAALIVGEKITLPKVIAALLMLVGSYLLVTNGQLIYPKTGDLLIIGACIAWSLGNVLIRRILKGNNISGDIVSLLRPIAGLPVMLLFILAAPLYPESISSVFSVPLLDFTYIGYVILSGALTALLWLFLNRTLKVATASYMTMMSMMTPVFVSVLAIVFLGESMFLVQMIGAILIIGSGIATHFLKIGKESR